METRQFGTDRRGGDLDGLLHPRNSEPRVGIGRGMVLVGAVDRLLFLLHRRAHAAHDDRVQIPEIHARRLVGADADRRRESLHAEILRLQCRGELLAVRAGRPFDTHHPQRRALLLVLQRRGQFRRLDGAVDGRILDFGALLPQLVDEALPAARGSRGMLRDADLGNPQRTGRTVRGLLGLHHDVAQHQNDRRGCFPDHRSLHLPEIHHHRAGKQHYPACPQRLQHKRPLVPGAPGKPGQTARTDG